MLVYSLLTLQIPFNGIGLHELRDTIEKGNRPSIQDHYFGPQYQFFIDLFKSVKPRQASSDLPKPSQVFPSLPFSLFSLLTFLFVFSRECTAALPENRPRLSLIRDVLMTGEFISVAKKEEKLKREVRTRRQVSTSPDRTQTIQKFWLTLFFYRDQVHLFLKEHFIGLIILF